MEATLKSIFQLLISSRCFNALVDRIVAGDVDFLEVQGDLRSLDLSIQQAVRIPPKFEIMA